MDRAALDEAQAALVNNIFKFYGEDDLPSYLEESQSTPFDNSPRAFIFSNLKEIPLLPIGEKDLLIILSHGKKKLQDVRARRSYNFQKLKSYDDNNEVVRFILKEGESRNIDLKRIANALFLNNGSDLRKIASEIRKISVLADPGSVVLPEMAKSVMCFSAELSPRSIVDAICDGQTPRALVFYDRLQEVGEETGWIIAYLHRHVVQQLQMERLLKSNVSDADASEILCIHPFIYKKMRENRSGLWSQDSLLLSAGTLVTLDIVHKQGSSFARFGLQLEIVRLSEESKNAQSRQ